MIHRYIDLNIVRKFPKKKTMDSIIIDIRDKYKIKNICDDEYGECLYCICEALYDDYEHKRANYKAYIEKGMDARMLMELRKSAVLLFADNLKGFYPGHSVCNTWQEVKDYRMRFINRINRDYLDLDWQYFYLVIDNLGSASRGFLCDFECCYADATRYDQMGIDEYSEQLKEAHRMRRECYIKKYNLKGLLESVGVYE